MFYEFGHIPKFWNMERILDQASFMFTSCINGLSIKNIDVIIGTTPHMFTPIASLLLAKLKELLYWN